MPYRQEGSPFWYISYTGPQGGRVRESSGTAVFAEAKALEASRRSESFRLRKFGEVPKYTFDEVLARYLEDNSAKKSHQRDLFSGAQLTKHFAGKTIAEIQPADLADYKKLRKVSAATIAKEILLGSAAVNYVNHHLGWNIPNPFTKRAPKVRLDEPRWLRPDEARRLLKACEKGRWKKGDLPPLVLDFVELGLATGMRNGEMLNLEWRRVDFTHRLIYFGKDDQKAGVPGSIPLNEWAVGVLRRRQAFRQRNCARSPWVFCNASGSRTGSLKQSFRRAAVKAKLGITPHALRHTFASWLVQQGVPLRTVAELCRHKDIRTTMRYAHLAPETAKAAIGLLVDPRAKSGLNEAKTQDRKMA